MSSEPSLIIVALGVHTGGGLTLLRAISDAWPQDCPCIAFLDSRLAPIFAPSSAWKVIWCERTLMGTLSAELQLARISTPHTAIFCFSSVPPIFARSRRVTVYVHNAYLIGHGPPVRGRQALRVFMERTVFRLGMKRVTRFWVQTNSMMRGVRSTVHSAIGKCSPIEIMPFWDEPAVPHRKMAPRYDFVYVSDGLPHKNHLRLFEAWSLLAEEGRFPTLAITLGPRDAGVAAVAEALAGTAGTKIVNLGYLSRESVMDLYAEAGALVFPSTAETFGLPLIEANRVGLPILASEKDYVRDVCRPVQTFDPESSVSISRAIKRQMRWVDSPSTLLSAPQMVEEIRRLPNR